MTRGGRTSRFAYDPQVVVAFLDAHSTVHATGVPRRTRRAIHGIPVDRDNEARIIRRWRNNAKGLTFQGVERVLHIFELTPTDLHDWATAQDLQPVLRGTPPL